MATTTRSTVVGVFNEREDAERAIQELRDAGFRDDQIGFAWRGGESIEGTTNIDEGSKAGEGLATGALIGGLLGAAAALLIPGIGPVLAGGILAPVLGGTAATAAGAAAAGAAVGAATGGLLGALVGLGVPEDEATYYDEEFKSGRIILTVRADGRYDEAHTILRRHGAYDMHSQPTASTVSTTAARTGMPTTAASTSGEMGHSHDHAHRGSATHTHEHAESDSSHEHEHGQRELAGSGRAMSVQSTSGEMRVPVHEEKLVANKTMSQAEAGAVEIHKEVVEEQQTLQVPVTREEVHVERRPASGQATGDTAFQEGTIRVPIHEERVEVQKKTEVVGEVVISKTPVVEQRTVSGTVRREEVDVDRTGGSREWADVMPDYRGRWQSRYGATGDRWEDYEPAYRFGYESYRSPRYQGRGWGDVELDLRRDWESGGQRGPWDKVKDTVRETWENIR